jgi:hypothetical protein
MEKITVQVLHSIVNRSPSLAVSVGTLRRIMEHPTPEGVWLELNQFYSGLTVADVRKAWTTPAEPPAKPKPGQWPLRLLTRIKSKLP